MKGHVKSPIKGPEADKYSTEAQTETEIAKHVKRCCHSRLVGIVYN
jgi:hypothetical protein